MARIGAHARTGAAIAAILGLAACGRPSTEGTAPGTPAADRGAEAASTASAPAPATDACALLSDAEFQQATGFGVRGKKSWPGESPGCDWELAFDGAGVHSLSLNLRYGDGRKRFDFITQSMPAVPGLGDAAAKTGGDINGTVWAVQGETLATVNYSLPVGTKDPDAVVAPLLRLVLSRQ